MATVVTVSVTTTCEKGYHQAITVAGTLVSTGQPEMCFKGPEVRDSGFKVFLTMV